MIYKFSTFNRTADEDYANASAWCMKFRIQKLVEIDISVAFISYDECKM